MWVGWESWAEELVLRAGRDLGVGVFKIEGAIRQAEDQGSLASVSAVLCGCLPGVLFGVGERGSQSLSLEGIWSLSLKSFLVLAPMNENE